MEHSTHFFMCGVDEHSHLGNRRRYRAADSKGLVELQKTWTAGIEIQADGISASRDCKGGVFDAGHATNLDAEHGCFPISGKTAWLSCTLSGARPAGNLPERRRRAAIRLS